MRASWDSVSESSASALYPFVEFSESLRIPTYGLFYVTASLSAIALAARLLRNPRDLSDLMGLWRLSRPGLAVLGRVAAFPGLGRPF